MLGMVFIQTISGYLTSNFWRSLFFIRKILLSCSQNLKSFSPVINFCDFMNYYNLFKMENNSYIFGANVIHYNRV